jgi:adenylosuccinate lyase
MIDRYSNPEIKQIWELENKYKIWLQIEILVCEARAKKGDIPQKDLDEIRNNARFKTSEVLEIESKVHHDMIAFLTNVADCVGPASRHIHYGLTTSDVTDTCLSLQLVQSSDLILKKLDQLIETLKSMAIKYKMTPIIGRTHGIHAEVLTLGLKFAHFYQELKRNRGRLLQAKNEIMVGKLSGAVGTYSNLSPEIEEYVLDKLNLRPAKITTQVICRDRHAYFLSVLGIIAGSLDRFATEIRLLQKTETREFEEPFERGQKGSSAMPHKRNPIICERICGLSRIIKANVQTALNNMPLWHERDISHSSAERVIIPDSIICLEYILSKMIYVMDNLHIYPGKMLDDIGITRGLIYSQNLLLFLTENQLTREEAYAIVQENAMRVWNDDSLNLKDEIKRDPRIKKIIGNSNLKVLDKVFQFQPFLKHINYLFKRAGLE